MTAEREHVAALNAQGLLCKDQAKYDEGRALYERALALVEQSPAEHGHDIATLLHNLGGIEHARGDFRAAEPFARRGLAIRKLTGDDDDALAADIVALAAILDGRDEFDEAEMLYLEALEMLERAPEANALEIAVALNDLGAQYARRGRTDEAHELLSRALSLKTRTLGSRHPDVAVTINNLAAVREREGDRAAAEALYREAAEIFELALGASHPKTMTCRANLARTAPLIVRLELTEEQQRAIRAQTGLSITALPIESVAPVVRCTFGGNVLQVPRGVFVPTRATECALTIAVGAASRHTPQILADVGTGCGAVALALGRALPNALVYATDVSVLALASARRNRAQLGLRNVRVRRGSLLSPLPRRLHGMVDVIVANVPYLPPDLRNTAARAFPEGTAIGTGPDGLGLVRELAATACDFLRPRGMLVLQLAAFQWEGLRQDFEALGYGEPELTPAAAGGPVIGRLRWDNSRSSRPRSRSIHDTRSGSSASRPPRSKRRAHGAAKRERSRPHRSDG